MVRVLSCGVGVGVGGGGGVAGNIERKPFNSQEQPIFICA